MVHEKIKKLRQVHAEKIAERLNEERLQKLLHGITKEMTGLEIGPSLRPCASKADGYHVEIIDHMDRGGLVAKYEAMGLDASRVEEVDYVWEQGTYSALTGKKAYYDYIIASHVIEHAPDFIGFLLDCEEMLKPGCILSLAVPDKRQTLDHFRMTTTTGKMVDDHLDALRHGSVGTLADYGLHTVRRAGLTSWSVRDEDRIPKDYTFVHGVDGARSLYDDALQHPQYHDIHQYVFTPASFTLLIKELLSLKMIAIDIDTMYETKTEEFIVSMRKTDTPHLLSDTERMHLIRQVSLENVVEL